MRPGFLFFSVWLLLSSTLVAQDKTKETFGQSLNKYKQPLPAKAAQPTDSETIKVNTELVVSDVLVVSPRGDLISNLKKDDFIVRDDGVPQEISVFSTPQESKIGRSIILVIGYGVLIQPYIHDSVRAASLFIDKIDPADEVAIVTDRVELLTGFTSDKKALKEAISAYEEYFWKTPKPCQRNDSQYSALLAALNELVKSEDLRPVVIFQTDGDEFSYLKPESPELRKLNSMPRFQRLIKKCTDTSVWEERPFSFENVKDSVSSRGATVYSIIVGPRVIGVPEKEVMPRVKQWFIDNNKLVRKTLRGYRYRDMWSESFIDNLPPLIPRFYAQWQTAMTELAGFSGGLTVFLEKADDAERIYDNILSTMGGRYVVGFYNKLESNSGKRRNLTIGIKGHPDYVVLSRKCFLPHN
jgi:VWFA-related protein